MIVGLHAPVLIGHSFEDIVKEQFIEIGDGLLRDGDLGVLLGENSGQEVFQSVETEEFGLDRELQFLHHLLHALEEIELGYFFLEVFTSLFI